MNPTEQFRPGNSAGELPGDRPMTYALSSTTVVYRITWQDPAMGTCLSWKPTLAQARAEAADIRLQYSRKDQRQLGVGRPEVRRVDLPTDAPGLAAWLSANFHADNG